VNYIKVQTLTFVPKVIGVVGLLVLLLPWMLRSMIEFTRAVIERIPSMVN
jgi:flagellar biosynthetic protein FliQ